MRQHLLKPDNSQVLTVEKRYSNPILILLFILFLSACLTWCVDSGKFQRVDKKIVPGTYQVLEKHWAVKDIIGLPTVADSDINVVPVGFSQILIAIPEAIAKQAELIVMILFIGGMFEVLNQTNVIKHCLEKLISIAHGRVVILIPLLMLVFSAGSTFLGLATEYLLLVPLMMSLIARFGLPTIYGLAIVVISEKLGYISSITNPFALTIAQPLVGMPIFSGMLLRSFNYILFLVVGVLFIILLIRRYGINYNFHVMYTNLQLSPRHRLLLLTLIAGIGFMVFATQHWHWKNIYISAWYLFLSIICSLISGLGINRSVDAFIDGMKKIFIATILISLATAVGIILNKGKILDTVVYNLANFVSNHGALTSGYSIFFSQFILGFAIPSISGQAAAAMPILAPLGHLSGVSPQNTMLAFLLGHGLANIITPTSSCLLVLLAAAQISWWQWIRFILPLFIIYIILAIAMLTTTIMFVN